MSQQGKGPAVERSVGDDEDAQQTAPASSHGPKASSVDDEDDTIGLFGRRKDSFAQRYHLTRRGKVKRLGQIAAIARQFDVMHGLTPVRLRLMLEALGPTFVKVGQMLSMRSEILPQPFCDELAKLRANADPMPYLTVLETLTREYGRPVEEISVYINNTPPASPSFAQGKAKRS